MGKNYFCTTGICDATTLFHSLAWESAMSIILVITLLLLVIYSGLILYYRKGWQSAVVFHPPKTPPTTSIAVIIPSRNEEKNLPILLNSLKVQDYPSTLFTVIVIDDHSTDKTFQVANNFQGLNIKVIRLSDHTKGPINSYKKKAIEIAIGATDAELIITTDADCKVAPQWLSTIDAFYRMNQSKMIVMPVMYTPGNNPLSIFQSLDFLSLQGITGAAITNHFHSMCNGANLAYTRAAFLSVKGYEGISQLASGDDMLLLQKISKAYPDKVHYLKSSDVIVETAPMAGLRQFMNQRIRWASKSANYKEGKIIAVMLVVYLLNLSLLVLPFVALFQSGWLQYLLLWLLIVTGKTLLELFFLSPVAMFFIQQSLLKWHLFAQPFHILYTIIAGFLGMIGTYTWKGRKVV